MTPEERIAALEKTVADLQMVLYNHKHKEFDRSKKLDGGTPGGSDREIQFNDGGIFGGQSNLSYDKINKDLFLQPENILATEAGVANFGGADAIASSNATGGPAVIFGGQGDGSGQGGGVSITAGPGGATGNGGGTNVISGDGGATSGNAGQLNILGGTGAAGAEINITSGSSLGNNVDGPPLSLKAGSATVGNANGGDIRFYTNSGHGSGAKGNFHFSPQGGNATTDAGGFIILQYCSGAPTGIPASSPALIYDTNNNDLYVYNAGWKKVHLA